jgi:predicted alpha/beta hydrolase family esterase
MRDHMPDHWQTLLADKLARTRNVRSVAPPGRGNLDCAARVRAIQAALREIDGPVVLVAHSGGAIMVAHWAQWYRRADLVGALLAAPADLETPMPAGYPPLDLLRTHGWLPIPRTPLPFRSIVAASSNDPLASLARVKQLALDWGSTCAYVGAVGHLNPASGFGEWPRAEELIAQLEQPPPSQ